MRFVSYFEFWVFWFSHEYDNDNNNITFSDYDAPLTEAGHYTAKYDKAAEMIAGDNWTKVMKTCQNWNWKRSYKTITNLWSPWNQPDLTKRVFRSSLYGGNTPLFGTLWCHDHFRGCFFTTFWVNFISALCTGSFCISKFTLKLQCRAYSKKLSVFSCCVYW